MYLHFYYQILFEIESRRDNSQIQRV